jgi:hypothetical protein
VCIRTIRVPYRLPLFMIGGGRKYPRESSGFQRFFNFSWNKELVKYFFNHRVLREHRAAQLFLCVLCAGMKESATVTLSCSFKNQGFIADSVVF